MTGVEFEDLLDRHGGDLARWPDASRAEAEGILLSSSVAQAALAAMREVEGLLAVSRQVLADSRFGGASDDALAARVTLGRQDPSARRSGGRSAALKIGWSAAAAALLVAGILTGLSSKARHEDDPALVLAQVLASTEIVDVE